jgi:hypothetical protein
MLPAYCLALLLQVLRYLQAFADHYHLQELIQFNCQVLSVQTAPPTQQPPPPAAAAGAPDSSTAADIPWRRWVVQWQQLPPTPIPPATTTAAAAAGGVTHTEQFDAVLVCNGHYSEPQLPQLPGAAGWPGLLMHSHSYRSAEGFRGLHVAVVGASFSGERMTAQLGLVAACSRRAAAAADAGRGFDTQVNSGSRQHDMPLSQSSRRCKCMRAQVDSTVKPVLTRANW